MSAEKRTIAGAGLDIRSIAQGLAAHRRVVDEVEEQAEVLAHIAEAVVRCFAAGGKLLAFGNGGSAADAQHLAAEFVGRFRQDRRPLPAIALTANTSTLTAIANDYGYEEVFARQVEALGRPGDVAVGISTSGRSPNVIRAVERARALGLVTVGLAGAGPSPLRDEAVICLGLGGETPRTQEGHILAIHLICQMVEESLSNLERSR